MGISSVRGIREPRCGGWRYELDDTYPESVDARSVRSVLVESGIKGGGFGLLLFFTPRSARLAPGCWGSLKRGHYKPTGGRLAAGSGTADSNHG